MILDSFILTFKDNSEPVITKVQRNKSYVTVPAQWLHDATNGRAEFIEKNEDGIEIAIPINDFLRMKDDRNYYSRWCTLVRLRVSNGRTFLSVLCHPIQHIDNRI